MTLRTRLLLAFAAVVLIPIALLAFGLRQEMSRRLANEYQVRIDAVVQVIREDLDRESAGITERLASLENALQNDNRFRSAAVAGVESEREYLLDYAGTAMRLTGLSMLQIQDSEGRIISSGHFRNEHGRVEAGLSSALATAPVALVTARVPEREFIALARVRSFTIADRRFSLIGGVAIDEVFLARLARDRAIVVSLIYPGGELSTVRLKPDTTSTVRLKPDTTYPAAVGELQVPLIRTEADAPLRVVEARLQLTQPLTPLRALLRSADSWFLFTAAGTGVTALLLAVWVSSRISRPLADLAEKTAVLDLDRLDVHFDGGHDEVGRLSRLLGDLASRLRMSTARVREAERRATVGDLARQINHDIKNGLIPLRNVMRHLAQVERDDPTAFRSVFAERRQTIDSSIAYLETLATSYQRLSQPLDRRQCDLNALITDVVSAAEGHERIEFATDLSSPLPPVLGDPIAFRRILENLTANAIDSLQSKAGGITISTQVVNRESESPAVRVTVADTGRGMSREETGKIFNDFYTTKEGGTGLGLSIVRRLVMDLHGTIGVESEPGKGTRITVDIPAGTLTRT
ncbi:MAG TPA: HAMP domain-containing sensor histidine kinase [Vicinamibacterales bacterium]|nr:HAMP domain-containing sensor histidine kinase [Vicinamibacterales bacterium]